MNDISVTSLEDLKRRLIAWITDPDHPGRAVRFSEGAARRAMGVASYHLRSVLEALEAETVLVQFWELRRRRSRGWGMRGALPPRRTLADLLILVEGMPEPADADRPRAGRRAATTEQTAVTALTKAQKRDIRGVASLIADYGPGAKGRAENVTAALLARTVDRDGRRVWTLEEEVLDWADARARAKAEARGNAWHPAQNADARAKHAGAIRLLLRLAVSERWLEVDEDENVVRTHSVEWHPHVLKWRARLLRRTGGKSEPSIRNGLQVLARVATRRGETDPATTDWAAVLREVEEDAEAGRLRAHLRNAVRWVWRRLHLLSRVERLPSVHERRLTIVHAAAIERTVASLATATSPAEIDFGGWTVDEVPLAGLIEGTRGLRRIMWFTAGKAMLVAGDASLPERGYERTYRRRPRRETITPVTAEARLRHFALLAGWAVRYDGASFACEMPAARAGEGVGEGEHGADTLVTLLEAERLTRYCTWRAEQPKYLVSGEVGAGNGALGVMLSTVRRTLADLHMLAEHAGKATEHLAAQIEIVERLRAQARGTEDKFRDCIRINGAWRPDGGRHGLEKLVELRDLLVGDACAAACGLSVDEQLAELRTWRQMPERTRQERAAKREALEGKSWRTATWATAIRRALLVQLIRKVPLREEALQNLTVGMLDATGPDGRPCAPWMPGATIIVRVPKQFTKSKRRYDVAYVARDVAGQPAQEEGAARWLLELMFCPGGAREWFVARAPGSVLTEHVFTVNAARGNDGHGRRIARSSLMIADGGLSADWRAILVEHGGVLGVDVDALARVQGGLGIHSVRYLFGRYWAAVRFRLDFASDMLHHGDLDITKRRYVGVDPSAASHDVAETSGTTLPLSGAAGMAAGELAALVESLLRENEALRRQAAA